MSALPDIRKKRNPKPRTALREPALTGESDVSCILEKRYYCNDHFSVQSIQYNEDREISSLVIVNDKGQPVYELKTKAGESNGKGKQVPKIAADGQKECISSEQMASLQAELERTGVAMETVQSRYKIQEAAAMSEDTYHRVMRALSKTQSVKVS